jgi:hypothetical protein
MFETLFKYPRVLARHREGLAGDVREQFLLHRANEGVSAHHSAKNCQRTSGSRQARQRNGWPGDLHPRS